MKKADLLISSVSAASIIAKVARDDYMAEQSERYPGYGFEDHVGYGTAKHRRAIEEHGVTPLHRRSFAPIALFVGNAHKMNKTSINGTAKQTGNNAEAVAADWLTAQSYEIIERNWKTKFCEIDIIALKNGCYYFVEVKHRKQAGQGGGIAAITPRKLRQMSFAADVYRKYARLTHDDAMLAVITTAGEPMSVEELLELR